MLVQRQDPSELFISFFSSANALPVLPYIFKEKSACDSYRLNFTGLGDVPGGLKKILDDFWLFTLIDYLVFAVDIYSVRSELS